MGKLSDVQIRAWIKAGVPLAISDGDGLTFTLSKAGTAAWVLRYRIGGRAKELSLGRYPDLTLSQARDLAARKRVDVQQGIDVAAVRRATIRQAASAWTFRQLAEDYLEKNASRLAEATIYARKQQLRDYVYKRIGNVPAKDVSPLEIVELIESATKKSMHVARLVLIAVREVFAHGVARHVLGNDPTSQIKARAVIGGIRNQRERIKLSAAELAILFSKLGKTSKANQLAVRILLSTGCRIGELYAAEWEHIDFQAATWSIPAENTKTKQAFVVPLPIQTASHFVELREMAFGSKWVLPIRARFNGNESDAHAEPSTLNAAIAKLCSANAEGLRKFSPHDLRSTFRSHLGELGIDLIVAERCLNHSLGGLISTYDKSDYLVERRRALELWSAKLSAIESGSEMSSNVVELKSAGRLA